jgi:hypothetical protein
MMISKLVFALTAFSCCNQVTSFVLQPSTRTAGPPLVVRNGFFDKIMASGDFFLRGF